MKGSLIKNDDFDVITSIIKQYFDGLYYGDVALLAPIFHDDAWLKAPSQRRTLAQWLHDVEQRSSPATQTLAYQFKILSIDIVNEQAMVKIHCPLFDYNYIDFLGLLKEQGQWLIVNKMYCDINTSVQGVR